MKCEIWKQEKRRNDQDEQHAHEPKSERLECAKGRIVRRRLVLKHLRRLCVRDRNERAVVELLFDLHLNECSPTKNPASTTKCPPPQNIVGQWNAGKCY